jgi:hypothetical protein
MAGDFPGHFLNRTDSRHRPEVRGHHSVSRIRKWDSGTFAVVKNPFIIFVDAMFTTLMEPRFTKLFDWPSQTQTSLACDTPASPINSLATLIQY